MDDEFEQMRRRMEEMLQQMMSGEIKPDSSEQFVYGISMRMGADGKPHIQKFGNTRALPQPDEGVRHEGGIDGAEEREPLTDVIEDSKTVSITVEIPGVNKQDIELSVVDQVLKIKVDSAERRYYKEVALPAHVDSDSIKATYRNGVLDITLKKLGHAGTERKIKVG